MRSNPLNRLGLFVIAVILVIISCQAADEGSPISISPFDWVPVTESIPADGVSELPLTVTVITPDGNTVQNVRVTFRAQDASDTSRTLGFLSQATVSSDANGQATTYLTSIESAVDTVCLVKASVGSDTSGWIVNPKTGTEVSVQRAPAGSIAIVSSGPLSDEEIEARLHTILLDRAYERAQVRRKGMGALLGGNPQGGSAAGINAADAAQLTVIFEGVLITLRSDKAELPADGVSQATITTTVATTSGAQVGDTDLRFAVREGVITPVATTNEYGIAIATLTSAITDSTRDRIVVRMGATLTDTLFQAYSQPVLTISADEATLPADRNSATSVRARLLTQEGIPIVGALVAFSLSGLDDVSLTVQGATNSDGEAIASLKAGQTAGTATVKASFSSLTASTTIELLGLNVTLEVAKPIILANGFSTTRITLVAKTQITNVAVVGQTVTFATDLGTIPQTASTNSSGVAEVTLKSGTTTGTATVTAEIGGVTTQATVLFTSAAVVTLNLSSSEDSILRDRQETSVISVLVTDSNDDEVVNTTVNWSLVGASPAGASLSTSSGKTNSSGIASVTFTGDAAAVDITASVQAAVGTTTGTTDIALEGVTLILTPEKTSILADGVSSSKITIVAKTTTSNLAVTGKTVYFATDLGTIPVTATTNSSGVASASLMSSSTAGTATVTAQIGGLSVQTQVIYTSSANVSVELSSDKAELLRDGQDNMTISAKVVDTNGSPLTGRVVTFALSGSGALSTSQPQQTGSGGTASVTLEADAATGDGTATIIAISEGVSDTLDIPLAGVTLQLTASPVSIVANGTNNSKLTLLLKETTSNTGVPNRTIQFSTTLGTIPAATTTDASGLAQVTLTSGTTSGTATVTATLGTLTTTATVDLMAEALSLNLTADRGNLLRDGISTASIIITVQDPNGELLNGRAVTWSVAGGGSLFPTVGLTGSGTDPAGTHSTTLTSNSGSSDATATVTVTVGDSTDAIAITLDGITITSFVQPDTILANGSETALFTWQASKTTSGAVIPSHSVVITKISGPSILLSNVGGTTNASGIAKATVTSSTNAGDLILQAELGGVTQQQSLHLLQDQFSVTLTSDDATLLRDGIESTELSATVLDVQGNPVSSQRVDFTLTGNGTLSSSFDNTNTSGQATVTLNSDIGSTNANAQIISSVSTAGDTLSIPLYGVTLSIKVEPDSLVADGNQTCSVEVTVKESGSNTPLTGRSVTFAFSPGTFATITAQSITDSRGIATATLSADTTISLTGTVTGRLGSDPATTLTVSTTLSIVAPVRNVSFPIGQAEGILRNNQDSATLTARVTDNNGSPVQGESVTWSLVGSTPAGASLSVSTSKTDSDGRATVVLTGDAESTDATASVKAEVGSVSDTYNVTLQGVTLSIAVERATITANGVDLSVIEVTLKETTAGRGIENETITFSTTLGTIGGSATTNSEGKATVNLIAGITAGTATVKAYNGSLTSGIIDSTTVNLVSPTASSVSLAASPTNLVPQGTGGVETSTVTATVLDKDNQTVPSGLQVEFTLSPSNAGTFAGSATKDTIETDSDGQAVIEFQSGTIATPVTITARVIGTTVQSSDAIITVAAGRVAHLDITATPISWNTDGLYERQLHIVVTDTFSNAVANQLILWTGAPHSLENSVVPVSTTDDKGVAHSSLIYNRGFEPISFTVYATAENGVVDSLVIGDGYILASATSSTILRDGVDTTTLTGTIHDIYGTNVGLTSVRWEITAGGGVLANTYTGTDEDGEATGSNIYQSDANTVDGTATIQASYKSTVTKDVTINLTGVTLDVSASVDTISANGLTTSTISAHLFKTTSLSNLSDYTVAFSTTLGSIAGVGLTDGSGVAVATLTAGTTTGTATVTATRGGLTNTTSVELVASTAASIALEALVTELAVKETGGIEFSTITATVRDVYGQTVPAGVQVQMVATGGTFNNGSATITKSTNTSGVVTYTYQSGTTPGTVTFTATSGSATGSADLLTVVSGPPATVIISYDDVSAVNPVNGISSVIISALVADAQGNAVATGTLVYFEITTPATGAGVIEPSAITATTGLADATLSYAADQQGLNVTIKVTSGGIISTLLVVMP